jgi:hypothetical protein
MSEVLLCSRSISAFLPLEGSIEDLASWQKCGMRAEATYGYQWTTLQGYLAHKKQPPPPLGLP